MGCGEEREGGGSGGAGWAGGTVGPCSREGGGGDRGWAGWRETVPGVGGEDGPAVGGPAEWRERRVGE